MVVRLKKDIRSGGKSPSVKGKEGENAFVTADMNGVLILNAHYPARKEDTEEKMTVQELIKAIKDVDARMGGHFPVDFVKPITDRHGHEGEFLAALEASDIRANLKSKIKASYEESNL